MSGRTELQRQNLEKLQYSSPLHGRLQKSFKSARHEVVAQKPIECVIAYSNFDLFIG